MSGSVSFSSALTSVVRYQAAHVPALSRYWARRGFDGVAFDGELPKAADEIPAVPTDVFRHVRLVSEEGGASPATVFRTSGTTSGARGEAYRVSTRAYDAGAVRWFRESLGRDISTDGASFPALVFDPTVTNDSSLSHMVGVLAEASGGTARYYLGDTVDVDGFRMAVAAASAPFVLVGTAFALVHVLDGGGGGGGMALPHGSLVVETGGYKGRSRELEKAELYREVSRYFGIPMTSVRSEYSMTELSSQLYSSAWDGTGEQRLMPPPWCRVTTVDPETLAPMAVGEEGLVRFVDLANVDTAVAIQTSDVGRIVEDGGLVLRGRAPGAVPRGCSLAVEEVLEVAADRRRERFT